MSDQDEQVNALRERFRTDFEFYCKHCVKIRTKTGEIAPFILNRVQKRFVKVIERQLETSGRVRIIVLKARQQGLSTFIMAWQYWWLTHHLAQKGLVMAHESESTTTLFDMYKRTHENVPELFRPKTKYSSRTELVFDRLDSALRVATAGGRGVARGETLTVAHLSEVAFWPVAFANANFAGLIKAIPTAPGTAVFIESTAQGMTGKFREMWEGAVSGTNGFEPFFSAWFESPEYRLPAPADFKRTREEIELAARAKREYGLELDNDQLQWRRIEVARDGLDLFKQECPSYADEAFLTTGSPVFNPEQIMPLLDPPAEPVSRWAVTMGGLEDNPHGELLVYRDHAEKDELGRPTGERVPCNPKETYVIGADVGLGIRGKDYSVAQILDSKKRQVAVWRGIVQPDYFAKILYTLGTYYNDAMVAVERNNHGLLTCVKLGRDLAYPNTWTEVTEGALEDKDSIQIGLYITERTKPLVIDNLRAAMRDKTIQLKDPTTLREMLTFIVTESGKMEGEGDAHDDTVMALAIANHVHDGAWTPCEVPDELYTYGI